MLPVAQYKSNLFCKPDISKFQFSWVFSRFFNSLSTLRRLWRGEKNGMVAYKRRLVWFKSEAQVCRFELPVVSFNFSPFYNERNNGNVAREMPDNGLSKFMGCALAFTKYQAWMFKFYFVVISK